MARTRRRPVSAIPPHTHDFSHTHKRHKGRRRLIALVVGAGLMVVNKRKKQQEAADEGVWHEAPRT
jgi:hypothetical protein